MLVQISKVCSEKLAAVDLRGRVSAEKASIDLHGHVSIEKAVIDSRGCVTEEKVESLLQLSKVKAATHSNKFEGGWQCKAVACNNLIAKS